MLRMADAFTIANATLGFLAITYTSDGKFQLAAAFIFLAVIADGLDGIVARRFGGGKPSMGDYLDIMADYLSFCVAPAILFYQMYFNVAASPFATLPQDVLVGAAAGLFMVLGLLRLARHVAMAGPEAGRFQGLPTTGAGLFATLLVAVGGLGDVITALLILGAGWLMVAEAPYPKIRNETAMASGALVMACAAAAFLLPGGSYGLQVVLLVGLAGASLYLVSGLAFTLLRVPLGEGHDAKASPEAHEAPRPPLARGEIAEEFDSGDDEVDELEALEKKASTTRQSTEAKEAELAKVMAERQGRKVEFEAMTRRLEQRETRMRELKERLRTEAAATDTKGSRKAADRLREIDRRELDLKRREEALIDREAAVSAREGDGSRPPAKAAKRAGKGSQRRDETQEVDPDA